MSLARCCSIISSGAQFAAEGLPDLPVHFYEQAEEEKKHALRIIRFVIDTGARINILAVPVPRADFKAAKDAIKLNAWAARATWPS
jgi:bacterioferritin B